MSSINKRCSKAVLNIGAGLIISPSSSCSHNNPFSSVNSCTCNYCNFLLRLYNFQKKNKCVLSRVEIPKLINSDFVDCFNSSLNLFSTSIHKSHSVNIGESSSDAKNSVSDRVISQHACTFSYDPRVNFEVGSYTDSRHFCDNVKHIFECFGASDQARGEFFPVHGESTIWHATCSNCGASCVFASPREGLILVLLLSLMKVRYDGERYGASLHCNDAWVHISKAMAMKLLELLKCGLSVENLEMKVVDPEFVNISSEVPTGMTTQTDVDFGVNLVARYPFYGNVFHTEECDHVFWLTNCQGLQMRLLPNMVRVLLMLMPGHGYLNGVGMNGTGEKVVLGDWSGIISAGGLIGVNVRCNYLFASLHERFYKGPMRLVVQDSPTILMPVDEADFTFYNAEAQASTGSGEDMESLHSDDVSEEADTFEEILSNLKSSKISMMDITDNVPFHTSSRGLGDLRKRVGGFLKGISNCVTKLHAVWDWPLDISLKSVQSVGEWLEENKTFVSDKIWSCQMCPEIQKDVEKAFEEQKKLNELFSITLKKLSQTLDDFTILQRKNTELMEKRIEDISRQERGSSSNDVKSKRIEEAEEKIKKLSQQLNENFDSRNAGSQLEKLKESNRKMAEELDRRMSALGKSGSQIAEVGEQMAMPRRSKISKQSSAATCIKKKVQKFAKGFAKIVKVKNKNQKKRLYYFSEQQNLPRESEKYDFGEKEEIPDFDEKVVEEVCKQADDLIIEGGETIAKKIEDSVVLSSGSSEEHNAMLANLYLGSFDWNVSNGEGSVLRNFRMPNDIWSNNERLRSIVSYFQYYSCSGLEFTITTTSIGMQGGTLMVCWDPLGSATMQKIDSVMQLSNLPHAYIHAAESTNLSFEIDTPSIQHMMCTSGSEASVGDLGTLKLVVANVLNAPSEVSQKVRINVWVKFKNPKLNFYTLKHDIVTSQSEDDLVNLGDFDRLEAMVAVGKWSTTSSTNLVELTVHPTACSVQNGLVTQTSLSVVSSLFNRWCGSLIYKIVFGASLFVKGKVMVCAIPVAFRNKQLTVAQMASFPCTVCDLSLETREFDFVVPYISIGKDSLVVRDSLYDVSSYNSKFVVSRLHMVVLDPLVMNANASDSISYFITCRPGSDFKLKQLTGVKSEFVDRYLKQSFGTGLECSGMMGSGFASWCEIESVLLKCKLDGGDNNALHLMVSPVYRCMPPCVTSLSWLAQLFVEWSGTLIYTFRAHSNAKMISNYIRVWYDSNGSTKDGNEMEFLSDVDPPAGCKVHYWRPSESLSMRFVVPFRSRTEKLILPKTRIEPLEDDWIRKYNGSIVVDYEGSKDISIEVSIAAGPNFNMYELTVPPRCGNVTNAYTKLSYDKQLVDIGKFQIKNDRLGGPSNKAFRKPIKFQPVLSVIKEEMDSDKEEEPKAEKEEKRSKSKKKEQTSKYKDGDIAENEDGEEVIYQNGKWVFLEDVQKQACLPVPICSSKSKKNNFKVKSKIKRKRNIVEKMSDIVNASHNLLVDETGQVSKLVLASNALLPLLNKCSRAAEAVEDKLSCFDKYRNKISDILKSLVTDSIFGNINTLTDKGNYLWATILTIIGGISLMWTCKTQKKFLKKLSLIAMIIWSPFLLSKAWKLGSWIKRKLFGKLAENTQQNEETCRKHSMAGAFEGSSKTFSGFTSWLSGNWSSAITSLLSLLGVVASLIVWGCVPNEKKLTTFASKFKAVGDKGRTMSNIFGGFNAIYKMSTEWSKRFVSWMIGNAKSKLPSADNSLQMILDFDVKQWVSDVREMHLQENRFAGFGADEHLLKVRRLYDKSVAIQEALLKVKVDAQLGLIVKDCKDKCTELMNESYTFKGMKKPRIDPLHVCLLGKPGVGKSTLTHVLINNLLDYRGEPKTDRIYTRCCADAYWSNYHQEPVVLYDDLGAIKSNIKLSDYAEIMGVKTNDPFSVPMAGVDDKGKHCTSRYIFSCTNVRELSDTGDVVTKLAYYRRRNILVDVERDPEIARDEKNPTKGLLFTVYGYSINGNDGNTVEFGVKDTWNESFLRNEDTDGWRFERVSYKTFLKFLCVYTDAYMESQENLLKGITEYKCDPFEDSDDGSSDDEVEAQAEDEEITMKKVIEKFDALKTPASVFHDIFKGSGFYAPDAWDSRKVMTFDSLMSTMCGCSSEQICVFDLVLSRFSKLVSDLRLKSALKNFCLKKVHRNPMETVFKKKSADIFEGLSPLVIFSILSSVYRMSFNYGTCYYHYVQKEYGVDAESKRKIGSDDFHIEDRIPKCMVPIIDDKVSNAFYWKSGYKLFPSMMTIHGYIPIFDGETFFYLTNDLSTKIKQVHCKEMWKRIWNDGFETHFEDSLLLNGRDRHVAEVILNSIDTFGTHDDFSDEVKKAINLARQAFGTSGSFLSFILMVASKNARVVHGAENIAKLEKERDSFTSSNLFKEYEKELHGGLSSGTKIILAISAGVISIGALAGLLFGVRKLFGKLSSSDDEKEVDEAEAESSGAHESEMYQTPHVRQKKGKSKAVKVKNLEKHVSGAQESEMYQTPHVSTRGKSKGIQVRDLVKEASGAHESEMYQTPNVRSGGKTKRVRAVAEAGVGVMYDEKTNLRKCISDEKKRAFKRKLHTAVAQAVRSKGKRNAKSEILREIEAWQNKIEVKGVHSGDDNSYTPLKIIASLNAENGESQKTEGEVLFGDPPFEVDHDVQDTLSKMIVTEEKSANKLVMNGTCVKVEKQAQVGTYGLDRDVNMSQLLQTHVSKMSCTILRKRDDVFHSFGVLRLKGTFVLAPAHYMDEFEDEGDELFFVSPHKVVKIHFDYSRVALINTYQDLVVWDLGNTVPPSPDFTVHLTTEEDWKNFRKVSGVLSITKYSSDMTLQIVHTIDALELTVADVNVPTGSYEMLGGTHTIVSGLRYRVHCMPGFCGAAVVRADAKSVRKIVGMHVAGQRQKGVGYAETIVKESILKAIGKLGGNGVTAKTKRNDPTMCEKQAEEIPEKGNLGMVGVVVQSEVPKIPTKTTIAPSAIHGMLGLVVTEPSILSTWDKRLGDKRSTWDPVIDAVKKYGVPIVPFPREEILEVEDHLISIFSGNENSLRKRSVNCVEIGINGIDGSDFWSPIEMRTSPGYPYVLKRPANSIGKDWLFEKDGCYESGRDRYVMKDGPFKDSFLQMHADILNGVAPAIITMECPKDERRKLSKIYGKPATRTFTILPPEINILFRMYFGDFAAMVMSTRCDSFSQVGINPESMEWSELMNKFKRVGERGFAGDYAKFDGIGSAEIYHSITNVVNAWYNDGPVYARARHALISAIVHRDGIAGNILFRYSQGMPSGFAMTVIFNSFVNYYYMSLAWMNIVGKSLLSPQSDLKSFDEFTKLIVYGDDNVVAVDEAFENVYNLCTVAAYLSEYGIVYTDDAKNPIHLSKPHVPIETVTFLKRSFVKVEKSGSLWKAPLDKSSIEERCNWIRQCEIPEEALFQNIESALYEASVHGKDYFDDLKGRIDSALKRVMLTTTTETYKQCQSRWWSNMTGAVIPNSDVTKLVNLSVHNNIDLGYKFKDEMIGKSTTLMQALKAARSAPLLYYNP